MSLAERWLLPDGVKEVLPPQAQQVETARRRLLDLYDSWGYELVMTPLIEHLNSLLVGVGRDLELNTFKVTDQLTGRMLGIRADITQQVARIDANHLSYQGPVRLCYCSTVLHTLPANPLASRNPLQVGAELFGHSGVASDVEIISLMVETLNAMQVNQELSLDLGHVGIYRGLMGEAALSADQEAEYFELLQRKDLPEIGRFLAQSDLDERIKCYLAVLPTLHGGREVLQQARECFAGVEQTIIEALDYLDALAEQISQRYPQLDLYFDLSELRGYNYHTGVVFAAYVPAFGQAVAKGGRYDEVGRDFGRARPATGFSADLKTLVGLAVMPPKLTRKVVRVPAVEDSAALEVVAKLRAQGERVVQLLDSTVVEDAQQFTHQLVQQDGTWVLESL
ncbi:ATP phosphoribosyltransferase regulatory subunit [Amphritea sp. 2_MG-2023]|jgi:ATP phosphoribosyltransferase regulatory subunit|uniref:ATP phosphoribosyltransferase regulatory subunit n=1 Tax=Amphritea TaxID=515417 RepID=UPI001C07A68F|nr:MULTISPECIES: ATP phosphoribosyltransferase regulatory subunit [Amphritea]MBU2967248.1 ATP phosphoribosyltransferase regulatory subunit [Amphritea atlantica]MDO6419254.1 ATP phosphoribosyltransferase regulatory subunit [Amphritea sp. 2_MG-2023]